MDFRTAVDLQEALEVLADAGDDVLVLAGGTDVMIQLDRQELGKPVMLSIGRVSELREVTVNGAVRLGALVSHRELAVGERLPGGYSAIREAALTVGGWQTQAVGTIGGNICNASPAADLSAPLLVNDAIVQLKSSGRAREIAYENFTTNRRSTARLPSELVTSITLAPVSGRSADAYLKVGRRAAMEVAIVGLAMRLTFAPEGTEVVDSRLALCSVGPVPRRIRSAELALIGQPLGEDTLEGAVEATLDEIRPIDDNRATAGYRRRLIPGLVRRAAGRCAQRAGVHSYEGGV
jgi:carbon-monoxide dehydrogenase medium subunit